MAIVVVLVVDDEPSIVALLIEILEEEGYRVVGACDGRAAFRIATETLPDIVLTDITMPQMSGIQLSAMMHADARTRHMPVILMSAIAPPRLSETSAVAFIGKPFELSRVVGVVARHAPVGGGAI